MAGAAAAAAEGAVEAPSRMMVPMRLRKKEWGRPRTWADCCSYRRSAVVSGRRRRQRVRRKVGAAVGEGAAVAEGTGEERM